MEALLLKPRASTGLTGARKPLVAEAGVDGDLNTPLVGTEVFVGCRSCLLGTGCSNGRVVGVDGLYWVQESDGAAEEMEYAGEEETKENG